MISIKDIKVIGIVFLGILMVVFATLALRPGALTLPETIFVLIVTPLGLILAIMTFNRILDEK